MACRADWYTRPSRRTSRGRARSMSYVLPFNPLVEPEECLLTSLIVVFGSVHTQGPTSPVPWVWMDESNAILLTHNLALERFRGLVPVCLYELSTKTAHRDSCDPLDRCGLAPYTFPIGKSIWENEESAWWRQA